MKFADMVFAFEVCFALLPLLGLKQTQAEKKYICFLNHQSEKVFILFRTENTENITSYDCQLPCHDIIFLSQILHVLE